MKLYVLCLGEITGPFDQEDLVARWESGSLAANRDDTWVRSEESSEWFNLGSITGIDEAIAFFKRKKKQKLMQPLFKHRDSQYLVAAPRPQSPRVLRAYT